jgi:hypothetical protein
MKKMIILAIAMILFMGLAVAQTDNTSPNNLKDATKTGITYTCPMHPEITSDKPGTCSKCGMDLVQKASVQYTCPMHPEVISDSPGKCPKCKNGLSGEIICTVFMPYASRSYIHGTWQMPEMWYEAEENKVPGSSNENGMLYVIQINVLISNCLKNS